MSSRYRSTPNEPVTEEERNRLSAQLNEAYEKGEIDQVTYGELLDQVFGAQKLGDLIGPVEALGKPATYDVPAHVEQAPQGRPGELAPARTPAARSQLMVVGGVSVAVLLAVILVLILVL